MKYPYTYHITDLSLYPYIIGTGLLSLIINIFGNKENIIYISLSTLFIIYLWSLELSIEYTYIGKLTNIVKKNIEYGYLMFILSEIIIFTTLFFSYYYNTLIPSLLLGNIWPPIGIDKLNITSIPIYNTILLFMSGITITISHHYIITLKGRRLSLVYNTITILLAILFVYSQYIEYKYSSFNISDSIYGTYFFTITGLHGLHVIIGIFFILIATYRLYMLYITYGVHTVYNNYSTIYYHFVDLVWIFVLAFLYIL